MNAGTDMLRCMNCGYDLRAHAGADDCPECGTSVEESRQYAARRKVGQTARRVNLFIAGWIVLLVAINALVFVRGVGIEVIPVSFGFNAISCLASTLALVTIGTCRSTPKDNMGMILLAWVVSLLGGAFDWILIQSIGV